MAKIIKVNEETYPIKASFSTALNHKKSTGSHLVILLKYIGKIAVEITKG